MRRNDYLYEFMGALYDELFEYDEPQYGTIYDIADVVYGAAFKSSLFNEDKEGYPLIRIRDLSTYSPQFYTAEEHPKRIFIEPGFVVAGMDAEFVPTFWLGEKAVLNQRVCHFAPPENTAISESYLLFALKPLLAYIQNYASGTTVAHMGKSDLEALKVPLPKEEDLLKFAEVAEPMRKAIVSNAIESKRLAELRDALLPKLMSGEIDVSKIDLTQLNNHLYESKTGGCRGHPLFRRCKLHGPLWSLEWIYHLSNTGEQLIAHRGSNQIIRFAPDRSSRDLLYRIQGHS